MDAFRSLIRGVLPPSGNPVVVDETEGGPPDLFTGYDTRWLDCGTSALAAALLEAKQRQPAVAQPCVILPAYGCPDLVSAAVYAGVKPVLVDLSPSDSRYDLEKLSQTLNASTIAIVAVNFMGLRENLSAIQALMQTHPQCCLIEDNAQWFPTSPAAAALVADFAVFSFGRGKPVSLLGGGLLVGKVLTDVSLPTETAGAGAIAGRQSTLIKYFLYNRLRQPWLYQFIDRNPLLSVGETRYRALTGIHPIDDLRRNMLKANIDQYHRLNRDAEQRYLTALSEVNQLKSIKCPEPGRLLRYPLLLASEADQRALYTRLKKAGLGVTRLYQQALPDIAGLPEGVHCPIPIEQAERFSQRLLTLPVHQGVTPQHRTRTLAIITRYFA